MVAGRDEGSSNAPQNLTLVNIITIVYNLQHDHLHDRNGGIVEVHGMRVEVVSEDAGDASSRAKAMSKPRM